MTQHMSAPEPAENARDTLGGPDRGEAEDELSSRSADGAADTLGGPDPGAAEDELGGTR